MKKIHTNNETNNNKKKIKETQTQEIMKMISFDGRKYNENEIVYKYK